MLKFLGFMLLSLGLSFQSQAQSPTALRKVVDTKAVPQTLLTQFNKQYPDVLLKGWYATHLTYWQNDYSAGWYDSWYGTRTVVVIQFSKPSYYEVEFINGFGRTSRAIYNLHGYWYETRTIVKGLPEAILESLQTGEFAKFKVSELKERIESPAWPDPIYRFQVSKGMKSAIIRMDEHGNFMQAKYVNE